MGWGRITFWTRPRPDTRLCYLRVIISRIILIRNTSLTIRHASDVWWSSTILGDGTHYPFNPSILLCCKCLCLESHKEPIVNWPLNMVSSHEIKTFICKDLNWQLVSRIFNLFSPNRPLVKVRGCIDVTIGEQHMSLRIFGPDISSPGPSPGYCLSLTNAVKIFSVKV